MRVQAGADRRTTYGERVHCAQRVKHCRLTQRDLRLIAGEFLAQCHRCGVLQVGTANLDRVRKGNCLHQQRCSQLVQGGQQAKLCLQRHGDMHGGGKHIVG